jgi:hypothetical protein
MRTRIFLGGSSQAKSLMREIAGWLEDVGCEPVPWDTAKAFPLGEYTFQALHSVSSRIDGAVLVLSMDEKIEGGGPYIPRGNVLLEAGLFMGGLGRMRTAICRDGAAKLPSDLDGITFLDVSAGKQHTARRRIEDWAQTLSGRLPTDPPEPVIVHPTFPTQRFRQLLAGAKTVRILQTFIPASNHIDLFERDLTCALDRGCEIDILVCHWRSEVSRVRGWSLGGRIDVKNEIEANCLRFGRIYRGLDPRGPRRLAMRAYCTFPSGAFYQVDDVILCGHYYVDTLAIEGPYLETVRAPRSALSQHLEHEFDAIWALPSTKQVDLEDVEGCLRR